MCACRELARRAERGFVIIGVVMMVLALTIIGLSLYGLSGYESQFFFTTVSDRQALYRANGGIELVKQLLLTPMGSPSQCSLEDAGLAVGRESIVSATAWQDDSTNTSGAIDWSDSVFIKVSVDVFGRTRTARGWFMPSTPHSPYHDLFATPLLITYGDLGDDLSGRAQVVVRGNNWQNIPPSDTTWKQHVDAGTNFATVVGQAPVPLSLTFIAAHLIGATQAVMTSPGPPSSPNLIDLDAGAGPTAYKFFTSPASDPGAPILERAGFDFVSSKNLRVSVRGTAIWLVPAGFRFDQGMTLDLYPGATFANLVLVVGPSLRWAADPTIGPYFESGLEILGAGSNNVKLFVVTHGSMKDKEETNLASDHNLANSVCFFATNYTMLPGPLNGSNHMERRYDPTMKAIADDLAARGLLPGYVGGGNALLTLRPGSWRESPGLQ